MTLSIDPYAIMVDFYDQWSQKMAGDVAFYVEESVRAPGPIVELAAGSGRVAIPVAEAGQSVIAVDLSHAMITEGERRAARAGVADRIRWVHDDMRTWVASPRVSLVTIPFRSFIHLVTTEDQLAALDAVGRSLLPGGRLVMNMFQPDPAVIVDLDGRRRLQADFVDERGRHCELWAINRYSMHDQGLTVRVILEVYEGGRVADVVETEFEARMVYRYEMEHLLARSGFDVESLYGGFDRRPFEAGCSEMIWVARKR